jgi:hypothetical protein
MSEQTTEFTREIVESLGAPFPEDEIEFLPRATSGGKALGLPYIDARSVMRRLDAAVGPGNWSFDFEPLAPDGKMVKGRLTVLGVTKCDAGEASTEDEPLKSAVSDALKRCAVHFGIGRYLYYLPRLWAPYDAQKRRFTEPPRLDPAAVERALAICGVSAAGPRSSVLGPQSAVPGPQSSVPGARYSARREQAPTVRDRDAAQNGEPQPSSGDRRPKSEDRAPGTGAQPTEDWGLETLACTGQDCGKPLTKGQHDVSVRAYGQPLCPGCQKLFPRNGATARVA